jgi:hypothetical protein
MDQNIMENNLTVINNSDHKDLSLLAFKRKIAGRQTERLFNVAQLDISLPVLQNRAQLPCPNRVNRVNIVTRTSLPSALLPVS